MKISTKGRYALRIMIDLAQNDRGEAIPLKEISERQGVTLKYMEQIMPLLTRAGYVRSFRGNSGGYLLAKEPAAYTVGDILRTTEGSLVPISCLEEEDNPCLRHENCMTLAFWQGLNRTITEYVDNTTLADLICHNKMENEENTD